MRVKGVRGLQQQQCASAAVLFRRSEGPSWSWTGRREREADSGVPGRSSRARTSDWEDISRRRGGVEAEGDSRPGTPWSYTSLRDSAWVLELVREKMGSEVSRICEPWATLAGYLLEDRGGYVRTAVN